MAGVVVKVVRRVGWEQSACLCVLLDMWDTLRHTLINRGNVPARFSWTCI